MNITELIAKAADLAAEAERLAGEMTVRIENARASATAPDELVAHLDRVAAAHTQIDQATAT